MDKILKEYKSGKKEWLYKSSCSSCNADRGYVKLNRINQLCRTCGGLRVGSNNKGKVGPNNGKTFTASTKQKMSLAKLGSIPWNKNKKENRKDVLLKISNNRKGIKAWNRGKALSLKQRIKLSCKNRNISIEDFDDFTFGGRNKDRVIFDNLGLSKQCFERDNYTCQRCKKIGVELNAHHILSFKDHPDRRFDLDNLITLCKVCHNSFHSKFSNDQLDVFLINKIKVTLITGAPGAGKSWALSQLKDKNTIDSDTNSINDIIYFCETHHNPIISLTIGISTFIKNNPQFDVNIIVIDEDIKTLGERIVNRGGTITDTLKSRHQRMQSLKVHASFSGTSLEVLNHLK